MSRLSRVLSSSRAGGLAGLFRGIIAGLVLALLMTGLSARAGKVLNDALVTRPFSHPVFQEVLTYYVSAQGEVSLVKLRANPRRLNQYLDQLAAVSPESHPDYFMNRNEELAYWINAHNAIALREILDIYPVDSLDQVPGLDTLARYRLGGKPYSLAMLRHKIVTEFAGHPNAILALTDFSMDAPPLSPRVFTGEKLPRQLLRHQKEAIADGALWRFVPGECLGLELSPWLKGFDVAWLAPESGDNAEAALDRPLPPEGAPAGAPGTDLSGWIGVVRPYAPPDMFAELNRPCSHAVGFRAPNRRLRQVR